MKNERTNERTEITRWSPDRAGCRRVGRRAAADALDDPLQIAVADRLAMLAERDDRVVDLVEILDRQREAERLAPALHGVAARVASEHELLGRLADVLRPHDLVGARVLEHPVLVDAGFVRERVAADDRLVGLHRFAGELREQLARLEQRRRCDAGVVRQAVAAGRGTP